MENKSDKESGLRKKKPVPPQLPKSYSIKDALAPGFDDEIAPKRRNTKNETDSAGNKFLSRPSHVSPKVKPAKFPEDVRRSFGEKFFTSNTDQRPCERPSPTSEHAPDTDSHLAEFDELAQVIRDRVNQIVNGTLQGLLLWGEGGTGKSFAVFEALKERKADYKMLNSQVTAKGLFEHLKENPEEIVVMEDAEPLFYDRKTAGILRSALFSSDGSGERVVTWQTGKESQRFIFNGAIIITSNRPLPATPEMDAVNSRWLAIEVDVTQDQIKAKMRQIASRGFVHGHLLLSASDCGEVCEFFIDEAQRTGVRLDLRLLGNGFLDRASWKNGETATGWQGLILSRLKQTASAATRLPRSKAQKVKRDVEVVEKIARQFAKSRGVYLPLQPVHGVKTELTELVKQELKLSRSTASRRVDAFFDQQAKRQPPSGKA